MASISLHDTVQRPCRGRTLNEDTGSRPTLDDRRRAADRDLEILRLTSALDQTRARYRELFDGAPVGYCDVGRDMRILDANPHTAALLGVERGALAGEALSRFVAPEDWLVCEQRHHLLFETLASQAFDLRMIRADGSLFWARAKASPATDGQDAPMCRVILMDINERRLAESGLRQMARAVEQSPASIVITDRAGSIQYVNAYFEHATGYTRAEALGQNPRILKSGLTPPQTYAEMWKVISEGGEWRGELCNRRKNGELYWEYAAISGMKEEGGDISHFVAVKEEISDRKRAQEALEVSLHEKDALLLETHHRVKNNLALIASLMRIEASRSHESETKAALLAMQSRIRSVVLLNETLYKTASYTRVNVAKYLREIATHVFKAQQSDVAAVALVLELEPIEVETAQAIPCGLIVNELITNALKHAFPDGRRGEVRVALRQEPGGSIRVSVSDTGVGLPDDVASKQRNSLGLQLVSDLARQLLGTLDIGPGAAFAVTFPPGHRHDSGATPRPNTIRP